MIFCLQNDLLSRINRSGSSGVLTCLIEQLVNTRLCQGPSLRPQQQRALSE